MPDTKPITTFVELSDTTKILLEGMKQKIMSDQSIKPLYARTAGGLINKMLAGQPPSTCLLRGSQAAMVIQSLPEYQQLLDLEKAGEFKPRVPADFFYTKKRSGLRFTRTQTGVMSIEQLLRSRPDYWVLSEKLEKKNKTLVIIDWNPLFKEHLKTLCIEFIQNGFPIYFYINNELYP